MEKGAVDTLGLFCGEDLHAVSAQASAQGLATQAYLRRLIAREAARPVVPDELATLAAKRREGRTPLSMHEFDQLRRVATRAT